MAPWTRGAGEAQRAHACWRPDLLDGATLTDEERAFAREAARREEGECDG